MPLHVSEAFEVAKNAGLDDAEAKLYLALLSLGQASHQRLSTRARINRSASYAIIERLKRKGLVAQRSVGARRSLVPVDPRRLIELEAERFEYLKKHIGVLEELSNELRRPESRSDIRHFEGKEGLKTVFSLVLAEKKEVRIFGDGDAFRQSIPGWTQHYARKRQEQGITARLLLKGTVSAVLAAKKYRGQRHTQIRVLPESYPIVGGFDVVGSKVVLYSFSDRPVAIVIEQPIISTLLATVFDILWQESEKYNHTLLRFS